MAKMIPAKKIERCSECDSFSIDEVMGYYWCGNIDRKIANVHDAAKFPSWCPLKDYTEKDIAQEIFDDIESIKEYWCEIPIINSEKFKQLKQKYGVK